MTCVWELEMTGDLHCFTTQQRNRVLSSRHKQCYSLDVCKWQMVAWVQDADDMRRILNKAKDKSRKTYIHEKSQKNATWFVEISPLTREHYTFFILHYFFVSLQSVVFLLENRLLLVFRRPNNKTCYMYYSVKNVTSIKNVSRFMFTLSDCNTKARADFTLNRNKWKPIDACNSIKFVICKKCWQMQNYWYGSLNLKDKTRRI